MRRLTDRLITFWLPVLLVFLFLISYAHSQVPLIAFQCENGVCMTTEEQVDRFERILKMVAERLNQLTEENEKLKGQCT